MLDTVKEVFKELLSKYNFKVIEEDRASSFGDALEVFESDKIKMRFISDRGQLFIDVASIEERSKWIDLNFIRSIILKVPITASSIDELAKFLNVNYDAVTEALNATNISRTMKTLNDITKDRWT